MYKSVFFSLEPEHFQNSDLMKFKLVSQVSLLLEEETEMGGLKEELFH